MSSFSTLCKYEFKKQFPFKLKKGRVDILGNLLSILITLLIVAVVITLLSAIAVNYVAIKLNKVRDPLARANELLNLFYAVIIVAMSFMCVETMRKTLTQKKDREMFLRLPVKPQTIFLSKLAMLMLGNYIIGFFLIVPVNVIIFMALKPAATFWLTTFLVWVLLPIIPFFIATVLLVPYIKFIDFVSNKYIVLFVLVSLILIGAFILYSGLLTVVQSLLETGSIKFLFNEDFINFLQSLLTWTYPANMFASIALGQNLLKAILIVIGCVAVSIAVIYAITKTLFYVTLYKNDNRLKTGRKKDGYKRLSPVLSLIKKEFISVFREPKHMFSYFAIATAMPIMVYCCYTLFESLISNSLGLSANFALALLIVLVFSILTNTFCATNISRDGLAALKSKVFPIKPSRLLLSKVLFCAIVSTLSVIVSVVMLVAATSLLIFEGLLCCVIGVLFSFSQIFLATRMDLNHAKVSASPIEVEKISNRTVSKVVFLGLVLAILLGIMAMFISIFATASGIGFIQKLNLKSWYTYLFPAIGSVLYLSFALFYYTYKIDKSFERLIA
ncbi:MAG: hypothetical protein E7377_02535 [Clostridiales bacterium]|nr:hypothetical protein [Clostridiales bacterium]